MRLRLARELHDEVASPLIALVLGLHELRGERDAGSGAEAELAAVEESVREVVRVIVLSAFADKSPISEAMASRPQGYVHKDVTPEDNVALRLARRRFRLVVLSAALADLRFWRVIRCLRGLW